MNPIKRATLFFLVTFFLSFPAFAQLSLNPGEEAKVQARLIAENDGIAPGKSVWVALRQEITPGWHTYWRNPGDTGLATTLAWDLPVGVTASELYFPTPQRHPTGGLVNYGYSDSVMLLARVTAPDTAKPGETLTLKAKASWLVCQDICIPETDNLELKLPITNTPHPGAWASAFIAARDTLPKSHNAKQTARVTDTDLEILLDPLPLNSDEIPEEVSFFPHDGLLIQHNAPQKLFMDGRSLRLTIPKNTTRTEAVTQVSGDILFRMITGTRSFQFHAAIAQPPQPAASNDAPGNGAPGGPAAAEPVADTTLSALKTDTAATDVTTPPPSLFLAVFYAILGGILLNLMPCVFPVLSLKALGLVHKSQQALHRDVLAGGLAYLCGVLATFTLLGIALIALKNAGKHIGWGIQFHSPGFVALLALLLFFIGYYLTGAITLGTRFMGIGQSLTQKSSLTGSFFTGALAVVVATPCTAPFMGLAVFYALTQSAAVTLLVLWALGIGLALPYVLLTIFPQVLLKYLPKPGIWMEHFKQFLAFPMLAASIWLVWVLNQQTGSIGMLHVLFAMLAMAFALWLWRTTQNRPANLWQTFKTFIALLVLIVSVGLALNQPAVIHQKATSADHYFEDFTPQKLAQYRADGRAVFVNMTAAWCITCLANEKAALSSDKVKYHFKNHNIAYLKGDWTNYDEAITLYLREFGRSGVPIYVYYPAGLNSQPVVLPQLLTPQIVLEAVQ